MLEQLKADVCKANLDLVAEGLVIQTWGNASGIDRERGLVAIKPSGVAYEGMKPEHMVLVSLAVVLFAGEAIELYHQRILGFAWAGLLLVPAIMVPAVMILLPWTVGADLTVAEPAAAMHIVMAGVGRL